MATFTFMPGIYQPSGHFNVSYVRNNYKYITTPREYLISGVDGNVRTVIRYVISPKKGHGFLQSAFEKIAQPN